MLLLQLTTSGRMADVCIVVRMSNTVNHGPASEAEVRVRDPPMVAMILLKLDAFSGTRHLPIVPRRRVAMLHALIFAQLATALLQLTT